MTQIDLKKAQTHLAEVIASANPGEEIIITQEDIPIAKLLPLAPSRPIPKFGSAKGKIIIREDFDLE